MSEAYRTLIGHFRHEVGHYYWDRLIANNTYNLDQFRQLFGYDRKDYPHSLNNYYNTVGDENWAKNYISRYATSHPWEDWAETWANYLHIMDITETAYYYGMGVSPVESSIGLSTYVGFNPYYCTNFNRILQVCTPILFAVNSINRSFGLADSYLFVINQSVVKKMNFIHNLIQENKISF